MQAAEVLQKLRNGGYQPVQAGNLPCKVMIKQEELLYIVCVIENPGVFQGQTEYLDGLLGNIQEALEHQLKCSSKVLALILSENISGDRRLTESRYAVWFLDPDGRRIVFDNQPGSFGRVERLLERKQGIRDKIFGDIDGFIPWVTLVLIGINVLIQGVVAWQEYQYGKSGLLSGLVLTIGNFINKPEYGRLLTSAFAHFGWGHLFNNMLVLFYLGKIAERVVGHWRFGLSYLICAVGSGAASVVWYNMQREWMVSTAGASGAVFGIAGMMLFLILLHRGRLYNISMRQMMWMILFTVYHGMMESGINNCAHVAGAVLGFLCGFIWWLFSVRRESEGKS